MRAAFGAMGGHGTDHTEVRYVSTRDYTPGQVCTVKDGSTLFDYPGGLIHRHRGPAPGTR